MNLDYLKKTIQIKLVLLILLIVTSSIAFIYLGHRILQLIDWFDGKEENFYWLFSSSAQSIATFFAFLLAGYTLFVSMMENLLEKDDSLSEIIEEEKRLIFNRIRLLAIVVAIALLSNLYMLFINGGDNIFNSDLIFVTFITTIASVILGIWVVIIIINPKKTKQIASKLIFKDRSFDQVGLKRNEQEFFSEFITLEKTLKGIVKNKKLVVKSKQPNLPSFREMVRQLYFSKFIEGSTYEELMEVNKYRNLLFHGEINQASETMVNKIRDLNHSLLDRIIS
jgi:hypothetical protein